MITNEFTTSDGFKVEVGVYNSKDYSAHVFIEDGGFASPMKKCNSIQGRDTYEVLVSEGKYMTKEELIRMFNL